MKGSLPQSPDDFFEAESPFEDGTNIPRGTAYVTVPVDGLGRGLPWYVPSESKARTNWKDKWLTLRPRFERLIDEYISVQCVLVQSRIPAFGLKSDDHPFETLGHRTTLFAGSGLIGGVARLVTPEFSPLKGKFAITGANGEPIVDERGEPKALRFGVWRRFIVQSPLDWRPEFGALPIPRLAELARDATNLLYELPPEIATSLWRNWLDGFSKSENSDKSLWLDTLFELSWQNKPGSSLHSRRSAWVGNSSYELLGDGLFPRLPAWITKNPKASIPHEHGYPLAYFSKLDDVARASIAAIDEILERAELMKASGKRFSVGLSFPGEHRPFVENVAALLGSRLGKGRVLYDKYHEPEFAQPGLDVYLPNLYKTECDLIAVFLCREYSAKRWCKLEWRSIRQLIETTDSNRIMLLSFDNIGAVPEIGILEGDGYVSIGARHPQAISELIVQRIQSLQQATTGNPK